MATYKFGKARSPPTKAAAFKGFPPEECGLQPALNSKVLLGIPYRPPALQVSSGTCAGGYETTFLKLEERARGFS